MSEVINVLVVDDSALVRKLLTHLLNQHPSINVIDSAIDAQDARAKIKKYSPDVVTLDIEMPGMDGLQFLQKIMALRPMPVVMISTLTQRGASASLEALRLGAFDCVPKPQEDLTRNLNVYRDELHRKVIAAASSNVKLLAARAARELQKPSLLSFDDSQISSASALSPIIGIGASTGGTEAVNRLLCQMPPNCPGIVISQHIPLAFAKPFAERLDRDSKLSVALAVDGSRVLKGHAYVAPGDQHLEIVRQGPDFVCKLSDADPVNRHRPSVDVMFKSLAKSAKNRAVATLLTGMGKDGADGLLRLKEGGARTLIQDEATSVVWGMPGAAFKIGAAEEVLPLDDIAARVLALC